MDEIRVLAPATVSNVVCGFDCLGFALEKPFDEMTIRRIKEPEIRIVNLDDFDLPTDPRKNVAGVALAALLNRIDADFGFEIMINKQIKPGSGIGSSSASSCAPSPASRPNGRLPTARASCAPHFRRSMSLWNPSRETSTRVSHA